MLLYYNVFNLIDMPGTINGAGRGFFRGFFNVVTRKFKTLAILLDNLRISSSISQIRESEVFIILITD